jgi:hypothetical protein
MLKVMAPWLPSNKNLLQELLFIGKKISSHSFLRKRSSIEQRILDTNAGKQ